MKRFSEWHGVSDSHTLLKTLRDWIKWMYCIWKRLNFKPQMKPLKSLIDCIFISTVQMKHHHKTTKSEKVSHSECWYLVSFFSIRINLILLFYCDCVRHITINTWPDTVTIVSLVYWTTLFFCARFISLEKETCFVVYSRWSRRGESERLIRSRLVVRSGGDEAAAAGEVWLRLPAHQCDLELFLHARSIQSHTGCTVAQEDRLHEAVFQSCLGLSDRIKSMAFLQNIMLLKGKNPTWMTCN